MDDPGVDARVSALAARIADGWGQDFHHAPLAAARSATSTRIDSVPPGGLAPAPPPRVHPRRGRRRLARPSS